MSNKEPSLEPIVRLATGYWATGILGTAVQCGIFDHLEPGPLTTDEVASASGLSQRGVQALLDGLVGLGLVTVAEHRYQNSSDASAFLVAGKPGYFGDFVKINFKTMPKWFDLPRAAKTGGSVLELSGVPDHAYWEELVIAIAPLSIPVAREAAERLGVAEAGAISILDVAGGAGAFSAVFLAANPQAVATQVDWTNVNRIARGFVERFGGGERFRTIDGDFLEAEYGDSAYDIAVYSHMAHGVTREQNLLALGKLRRALKPGGTLVINEFVVRDDDTAHPFILTFSANILFHSSGGRGWREADYREWLRKVGFNEVEFVPTNTPANLIYAR